MTPNNMKGINTILLLIEPELGNTTNFWESLSENITEIFIFNEQEFNENITETFIFDKQNVAEYFGYNKDIHSNENFSITNEGFWGGEDEGSDAGFVLKFTALTPEAYNTLITEYEFYKKEFYVKFPANYDSWNGYCWLEPELVKPVPKVITTWESL